LPTTPLPTIQHEGFVAHSGEYDLVAATTGGTGQSSLALTIPAHAEELHVTMTCGGVPGPVNEHWVSGYAGDTRPARPHSLWCGDEPDTPVVPGVVGSAPGPWHYDDGLRLGPSKDSRTIHVELTQELDEQGELLDRADETGTYVPVSRPGVVLGIGVYNQRFRTVVDFTARRGRIEISRDGAMQTIYQVTPQGARQWTQKDGSKDVPAPTKPGAPFTFSIPIKSGLLGLLAVGKVADEQLSAVANLEIQGVKGTSIRRDGKNYGVSDRSATSIGRVREYWGNVHQVIKAYAWTRAMGAAGIAEASDMSVLMNNYMEKELLKIRGITRSHPAVEGWRLEMTRFSLGQLYEETGVSVADVQNRMVDFGVDAFWMSHEPWIVPQPFTPEAGEMWSKEDVDYWIAVLRQICAEAYSDPELVKSAPHRQSIHKLGPKSLDDPQRWAMTWRAYQRKRAGRV
ncbi:MAG: hypothetical protein HC872_06505, partial [Gammaproteobacteria bacterium]|nr:hypothetical protein [Gammaproteobacteria bacterium]